MFPLRQLMLNKRNKVRLRRCIDEKCHRVQSGECFLCFFFIFLIHILIYFSYSYFSHSFSFHFNKISISQDADIYKYIYIFFHCSWCVSFAIVFLTAYTRLLGMPQNISLVSFLKYFESRSRYTSQWICCFLL